MGFFVCESDKIGGMIVDKIYTKTGDHGYTRLGTGSIVRKTDQRVEAYGTVDELSSFVGLALSTLLEEEELAQELLWIQRKLFVIASLLAFPGREVADGLGEISPSDVAVLERAVDRITNELPSLTSFVLPGGVNSAATLHCARSVCRRAERRVTELDLQEYPLGTQILPFLNRLSDYFFCAARLANQKGGFLEWPAKDSGKSSISW